MLRRTTPVLTLAAACVLGGALSAGPAMASHGADDGPDDNGHHGATHEAGDDNGGDNGGGRDDDRVIRRGTCSGPGSATWKLKVKTDDGRLEVEGEVDSNRTGQRFAWVISDNGDAVARGTARTAGRSGSFSVERKIRNRAGQDAVVFRATRAAGNGRAEVCAGRIVF
ncbi:hypothetical protein ABFT23_17660 [Nocardioides sp. C4-1]|uniref:hypothetical protein n=1 Tax=Nocardioides sp. C4-1 TaxID=3151851 RepID=UPI003266D02B